MEETTNKFIIDTKKFCFMCLHNGNNGRPGPASITAAATTRFSFSMKGLTRFLKVDLQKVFNINMTPSNSSRNLLDETDILVSLCKVCFMEATKFDQLYQELKQIERRVKDAVRTLHQLMAAGESNPVLVESFNQRMKSTNPFELIQKSITENFRKETIEKLYFSGSSKAGALVLAGASNNNQTNRPGSSGTGFNGVHQSQSRSHLTTPSIMARRPHPQLEGPSQQALARGPPLAGSRIKMKRPLIIRGGGGGVSGKVPPPPALSRLKPPVPPLRRVIPATSSNNSSVEPRPKMSKKEVPCVDLDSDPEENSPDLVINSVSSVNGITITYPGGSTSTSTLSDYQQQLQNSRFNELEITPCSSASVTSYGNGSLGFGATHATMSSAAGSYYGMTQNPNSNLDFDTTNLLEEAQRQQISNSAKVFIQCIHCQQKFTTNSGLRNHILAVHRAELFAQFKKPEKTPEEFKEALDKVFFEYGERNGDVNCWPCLFCEKRLGYKHTAEAHMIQSHFDNISEMLVAWQDGAISLTPEQIFKLGQSRGNVSSSGLSGAASCDAILQEALNGSGPSSANDFAPAPATVTPVPEVTVSSVPSTSAGVTIKLENDCSPFKCKICDKGFNDAVSLEGHTLIKHSTDTSALASTATYSCAHCQKRFSYYHVQRVHVFTRHRTEELSKHLPKDTPVDEIEPALTPILNNYVKLETGKKYGCPFSPCTREFSHTEYTMLQNHVWLCHFEELLTRLKAAILERIKRMDKNKSVIKKEIEVGLGVAESDTQVKGQEDKGLSQAQVKTETQTEVREGKVQSQTQAQVKTEPEAGETGESNSSKRVKTEPLEPVEPLTNANAINSSTPSHSHPHRVTKIETEAIDPEPVVDSMLEILPDLE